MTKFSANLGFLWQDRPLPDAIRAAKAAGFDAVECHWPYDIPAKDVKAALDETGLSMLGLNTRRGDVAEGENGLAALTGRTKEARAAIDEALSYAQQIGAGAVHVMCGNAEGTQAHATFVENLRYACTQAFENGRMILIEPLNAFDAPDYFLRDTAQAERIIKEIDAPNLRLMFDCYHVARTEGSVGERLSALLSIIGHIQFASVPDRGRPDQGDLDYCALFETIDALGWQRPLGAEYRPLGRTDDSLSWLDALR